MDCSIAHGVSSHSWQISTPAVRTSRCLVLHGLSHLCLSSHEASKVGRWGVNDEVTCGPGLLGRDESACLAEAECDPAYSNLWVALETQGA